MPGGGVSLSPSSQLQISVKGLPWRLHSQTSIVRSESSLLSFSKPKSSTRFASSWVQICAKTNKNKTKHRDQLTWAKAKFNTVSEAKYCSRYSLERASACRSTGSAMVGEEDRQYSSATDSRTLPTNRRTWMRISTTRHHLWDARETPSYLITISVFLIFWQWINNFCKSLCASVIWFWACSTTAFLHKQNKHKWLCWCFARVISIVTFRVRIPISSITM